MACTRLLIPLHYMSPAMRIRAPAGPATPQVMPPFQALFFGGMAPDPLSGTWTGTRAAVVAYAVEMTLVVVVPEVAPTTCPTPEQVAETTPPLAGVANAQPSEAVADRVTSANTVLKASTWCASDAPATRVTVVPVVSPKNTQHWRLDVTWTYH